MSHQIQQTFCLAEQFSHFLGEDLTQYYFIDCKHHYYHITTPSFTKAVSWLREQAPQPVYLISTLASDERSTTGCFHVYSIFFVKEHQILMTLVLDLYPEDELTYPAMTPQIPSAEWAEREIQDLFGLTPVGFDLKPLVLHRDWPRGNHFPMRKDFSEKALAKPQEVPHQFEQPQAAGMHQVAVGPIHAGIIEPGHLRFCVTGERVHQFDAQLFYTHKGVEKMAEGKHYKDVLELAERVCGLCSFSHSTAYCQAIEQLGGIEIPHRAQVIRGICLELERLASHFADLTAICSAGGFGFGSMQAANFREHMMVMNEELTGSRFLRRLNDIGGLKRDIPDAALEQLRTRLNPLESEFRRWIDLVLQSDSLLDRLEASGYLSQPQAEVLNLVGPSARGSGISRDVRRDFPYGIYRQCTVSVPMHQDGDVLARTKVRMDEALVSFELIKMLISSIQSGVVHQKIATEKFPNWPAISLVESAKGELFHWVVMDEDNKIARWHVRSASYLNWRGVVQATMGNNIVPDGPLINKSFNLCYACTDR